MQVHLVAVGEGMPAWVARGVEDYAGRLGGDVGLRLVEVSAGRRTKSVDLSRVRQEEGRRLLAAAPEGAMIIALDERGGSWSTRELARRLDGWRLDGRDVALLVGGADGHDRIVLEAAEATWSLSRLTFPHMLVRVIVAEQIYRAWSVLAGHPYHR